MQSCRRGMPPLSIKDLRDSSPDESRDRTEDKPAGSSPPQQFYLDNEAAVEAIIAKSSSSPVMAGGVPERSTELPLPRFWSVAICSGKARQRFSAAQKNWPISRISWWELLSVEPPEIGVCLIHSRQPSRCKALSGTKALDSGKSSNSTGAQWHSADDSRQTVTSRG